jgi:hypothetical protein
VAVQPTHRRRPRVVVAGEDVALVWRGGRGGGARRRSQCRRRPPRCSAAAVRATVLFDPFLAGLFKSECKRQTRARKQVVCITVFRLEGSEAENVISSAIRRALNTLFLFRVDAQSIHLSMLGERFIYLWSTLYLGWVDASSPLGESMR